MEIEERLPALLVAHPLVQKDKCLEEVIDACTDFLWGEAVQQQLQGLHALRYQVDAPVLHRAGQEAQQTRMPQGLQVLQETKTFGSWLGLESLLVVAHNARLDQCADHLFCQDASLPTLAALLTLSSLPAL